MPSIRKQKRSRIKLKPIIYTIGLVLIGGYLSFLNHSIKAAHNGHYRNDIIDENQSEISEKSRVQQKDKEPISYETKTPIAYGKQHFC